MRFPPDPAARLRHALVTYEADGCPNRRPANNVGMRRSVPAGSRPWPKHSLPRRAFWSDSSGRGMADVNLAAVANGRAGARRPPDKADFADAERGRSMSVYRRGDNGLEPLGQGAGTRECGGKPFDRQTRTVWPPDRTPWRFNAVYQGRDDAAVSTLVKVGRPGVAASINRDSAFSLMFRHV